MVQTLLYQVRSSFFLEYVSYVLTFITETAAESQTAYFRGRKLKGKAVKIPSGYEGQSRFTLSSERNSAEICLGLLLQSTSKTLPQEKPQRAPSPEDDDLMIVEQEDEPEPVKILELVGSFDDVLVWDHEAVPESDSAMVKGVEEWIRFAEAVSSTVFLARGNSADFPLQMHKA